MKVLISSGYGTGWSSWNQKELAFDPQIIEAFEKGITAVEMSDYCADLGYDDVCMGGFDNLRVVEVPVGTIFRIKEYDGHESIEIFNKNDWIIAD